MLRQGPLASGDRSERLFCVRCFFRTDSSLVAVFAEAGHGATRIDAGDDPAWVALKLSLSNGRAHLSVHEAAQTSQAVLGGKRRCALAGDAVLLVLMVMGGPAPEGVAPAGDG